MVFKIYNTMSERVEEIKPLEDNLIKMYSCGPTVYDYAHIGNLRYFIFVDLLKRALKKYGYKVYHVMNITDIDDKIIQRANERHIDYKELAQKYEKYFFEDLKKLKIQLPDKTPRATEEIQTMSQIIEVLLKKGVAYERNGSIYYAITKFPDYGKLSKLDKRELKTGARVEVDSYDKDNPSDFALWKAKKKGEPFFKTPFGEGRPGWHIECSAMSYRYLGEQFDIHTGGVDLIFPHHENEIAQSEMFCGHKTVNYWVHSEHLFVEGKKMSKSLGNFYTLRDLEKRGYSLEAIRYLFITTHYKTQLNFTFVALNAAENTIKNVNNFIDRLYKIEGGNLDLTDDITKYKEEFFQHLFNNLEIGKSVATMHELINKVNKNNMDKINKTSKELLITTLKEFNEILDVFQFNTKEIIPDDIKELAEKRWRLKKERNFAKADEIRSELLEKGYIIEDKRDSYIIRKI